jgi:hypothetical protein
MPVKLVQNKIKKNIWISSNKLMLDQYALPKSQDVLALQSIHKYDEHPYDLTTSGFRNELEGWKPVRPSSSMHNAMHVWINGPCS